VGPRTPTAAAAESSKYNTSSASNIGAISDLVNSINLKAQQAANQARIPGAAGLETKSSANIGQELAGQVPTDVTNLLAQQAAETGTSTGMNTNAAYLKALGLTSLGQEQAGQQNLSAAYARNPVAQTFDPTTQLLTPAQGAQLNLGYQTEADRAAEAQQQLAIEAARGSGGRGGSPFGYGSGGTDTGSSPFTTGEPGMYSYSSPSTTTLSSGEPTSNPSFNWLASLGAYTPAGSQTTPDYSTLGTVLGGYG